MTISVAIQAVHETAVVDTINEALRELAMSGAVDDYGDDGWVWTSVQPLWINANEARGDE